MFSKILLKVLSKQPFKIWLIFGGFCYALAHFAVTEALIEWRIYNSGQLTEATVIDKWIDDDEGTSYRVEYQYTAANTAYKKVRSISKMLYNNLTYGEQFNIRYLASNPNKNRLLGEEEPYKALVISAIFCLPFTLLALAFLGTVVTAIQRAKLYPNNGQHVDALVENVKTIGKKRGRYIAELSYGYEDNQGTWQSNTSLAIPSEALKTYQQGDLIHVVYHPHRPNLSIWPKGVELALSQ